MQLRLTDTLTRAKGPFVPADPKRVTMYVCGPTVYNYAHIGNARPPVVFDVLYRLLRAKYGAGHVLYARNFTDVDDRIIARAAELGEPVEALTQRYEAIYREDMTALGNLAPTHEPRATEHIVGMCEVIGALVDKGAAYKGELGVWFSVSAAKDYGKLSGREILETPTIRPSEEASRVTASEYSDKHDEADFALWKAAKPGEPAWDSPFGKGRPGWHIECSAMIRATLGADTIDIHAGGIDLVFPHHENEIAQSETAYGKPLARVWMHNGFLDFAGEKMSKSLGNVVYAHDLLKEWPGEVLRWALLSAHYRAPLDWNRDLLTQSKASLDRLYGALRRLKDVEADDTEPPAAFAEAIGDDLNTPEAMAALFALASEANKTDKPMKQAHLKGQLLAAGALMGLLQQDPETWFRGEGDDVAEIDRLVAARAAARQARDFAEADRLRKELADRGVEVMDNAAGSTWKRVG